jgi:phytanoyl-CoA hydroxylase
VRLLPSTVEPFARRLRPKICDLLYNSPSVMTTTPAFQIPTADTEIGRQFARDGYYLARGIFSRSEVRALESEFDRIVDQILAKGEEVNARWGGPEMERIGSQDLVVLHTHNVHQYSAVWAQALFQEKFVQAASEILGPDVVMHHTKLFQKPSEKGAPFPMHQDWSYFPTVLDSMMAGIIHVSEANDEMGCLRVYPGSHLLGRIENSGGQSESDIFSKYPLEGATPLEAEPGDVCFFHYCTIHGSLPNRSAKTRKTVLVQLHSGKDKVEDGAPAHPNERLVIRGWNYDASRDRANSQK